jgi:M6 family metalloprotease-like protein
MKKFIFLQLVILYSIISWAAPLKYVKIQITQPNGKIIDCYASGDEYYNWPHDKDNYTIIQDSKTGYYCFAINENDSLIASKLVVGIDNPAKYGLKPGINYSPNKINKIRLMALSYMNKNNKIKTQENNSNLKSATTVNTINNLVVYIRFSDQDPFPADQSTYSSMFNSTSSGANSMRNYFKEASYNNLDISSTFYPLNNGTEILSYQDSHPQSYYLKYSVTDTSGHQNDNQRWEREETLLTNAINFIKDTVPTSLNIDYNNDGYVDNICFIIRGSSKSWADLLWPHKSNLASSIYINYKRVSDYNFHIENNLSFELRGNTVWCHEFFHTLGAPDLYHYTDDGVDPVGIWDIMGEVPSPPQSMCAYMKYKYGNWINSIPEITQSGHYTLNPITSSSNNCFKVASPYSNQFFILEFRKKSGTFENSLPGTGLLIYRIYTNETGNSQGPLDEIYVYRPNGSSTYNGEVSNAYFDSSVGRSIFNDSTNPNCFLIHGEQGKLYIKNIVVSTSNISFDVRFCDGLNITYSNSNPLPQFTNAINTIETSSSATVYSSDNVTFESGQGVLLNGFYLQQGGQFEIAIGGCGNINNY